MGKPIVAVNSVKYRLNFVSPWLFMRLPVLRLPKAVYKYDIESSVKKSGVEAYALGKSVETAGSDKHIMIMVTGTTISEAYLTENWKMFFRVSLSFFASSLENAGNSIVITGVAKKVIRITKFPATP
jgi:hypothetical protein